MVKSRIKGLCAAGKEILSLWHAALDNVRMASPAAKKTLTQSSVGVCEQLVCRTPSAQSYASTKQ